MSKFFGLSKVHHLFLIFCISWEEIGYEVMLVLFYGEFYMFVLYGDEESNIK